MMLSITRKLAKLLRAVFRKANDGHARNQGTVIVRAADGQLHIQFQNGNVAVEYAAGEVYCQGQAALPFTSLADFEGIKEEQVQIHAVDKFVRVEWNDHGVPLNRQYPVCTLEPWLETPAKMAPIGDGSRMSDLMDVVECAATEQIKFVLDSIQLRGGRGDAVGSDGRQLLIKRGFEFPWKDDVLIPSSGIFGCRQLNEADVLIGRTKKHVVFQTGPWTVWLAIKEGRYPKIDQIIPTAPVASRVIFNDADAKFLTDAIPRLPGNEENESAVTVHANGRVNVLATNEAGPPTELVLENSRVNGKEATFVTNRHYLKRAIQLGMRELQVRGDLPIVAQTDRLTYLWMPLSSKSAIPSTISNKTTSEPSTAHAEDGSSQPTSERPESTMNDQDTNGSADEQVIDPLDEAEAIKVQLRDVIGRVSNLIAAIKRQRKQAQIVRSTLASLKQLQEVA